MPSRQLALASMFLREILARDVAPRAPGPTARLGARGIRAAMDDGGAVDGRTAAGYLFHSARISRTIAGARHCVDFGCGSAVQLLQVAALNPHIHFTGVDREPVLLERAAARAAALGIINVSWLCDDITAPRALARADFDAVISTMTLHDLPDRAALDACLRLMHDIVGDAGAVYIEDFGRLKTTRSMDYFVALNAPPEPDAFSALYRTSLGAAFTRAELAQAARALPGTRCHATFIVPFLVVIKTPDRALAPTTRDALRALRDGLLSWQRRDLDELAQFFALGGLRGDPFG
ncbi:MAG: methyltransferase domain-containing protein [Gammaproteobacteria bacterium]